jgi:hypothetical protein
MTSPRHEFEGIQRRLQEGWRWSEHAPSVSEQDLAAWAESPSEDEAVEALLASDADLRAALIAMRLTGTTEADEASPHLRNRIARLMPAQRSVIGRIGMWAAAAAAAVLLALGGWQLGSESSPERSLQQDTLAFATFGLNDSGSQDDASFLTYASSTEEARQ